MVFQYISKNFITLIFGGDFLGPQKSCIFGNKTEFILLFDKIPNSFGEINALIFFWYWTPLNISPGEWAAELISWGNSFLLRKKRKKIFLI